VSEAKSKIGAIAPWFGGKRTLARTIVGEFGPHRAYWEPFCGSMAVLFAKPASQQETVCDLHGPVTNLARMLANEESALDLYKRAAVTLSCEALYYESLEWLESNPGATGIVAAYHFLVVSWQGRNGTAGTRRTTYAPSRRYTPGGGSTAGRWRSAVESIPWWHDRLRNVLVLNADGFKVLPEIADEDGVVVYADPPYLASTRADGGGSVYQHDFRDEDHERLAEQLCRFRRSRVVVSYYESPRIRELYPGWTVRKCTMQKNLHVQNRRGIGNCEAPEILLLNGPSLAGGEGMLFS